MIALAGSDLAVRLSSQNDPLVDDIRLYARLYANDDGINNHLLVSCNLLRLNQPTPVLFEIFDLLESVRRLCRRRSERSLRPHWNGIARDGNTVPWGSIYTRSKLRPTRAFCRQGLVNVVIRIESPSGTGQLIQYPLSSSPLHR